MQEKALSIIIVSYNCYELLKECIDSIHKYNDIGNQLEIIVVDNGSDGTYSLLRDDRRIKCIKTTNKGFGAGNNEGFQESTGRYLLFLNPDTIITESVFQFAVNQFEKDSQLGAFGVQLVDANGNNGPTCGMRFKMGMIKEIISKILIGVHIFLHKYMFTSGADLFVRREAFVAAGEFDEKIFMYCEEADLANRINSSGYCIKLFRDKRIVHLEGKTSSRQLSKVYIREIASKKYYCEKYGIDFHKYSKKEYNYCKLKQLILKVCGKSELYDEYKKINEHWEYLFKQGQC